jgi:hypothetical protein
MKSLHVDTNYTFTISGKIFVKIYSVAVRVLVLSRPIVLTAVLAYIQVLSASNWERRDHTYN